MRPAGQEPTPSDFLDPAVLATIGNLELLARTVVDGFLHGLHRSSRLGLSMEFAEHRPYMPGDDIRRVDWRLYGRTDRYYLKTYEAETNARVTILLDVSRSMTYRSGAVSKLDYGRFLAACLAWFSGRQRDRIGLVLFDGEVREWIPPSTRHLRMVLHAIDRLTPGGGGGVARPLAQVAERLGRRGLVVIISDFYDEPDAIFEAVTPLRFRGHDVVLFHVLDPAEVDFSFAEPSSFEDLESGDQIPVVPDALAAQYRALIGAHIETLATRASAQQLDYMLLNTSMPLDFALFRFLSIRERLAQTR
jgi:uncharacterized protein (DUF58 family)